MIFLRHSEVGQLNVLHVSGLGDAEGRVVIRSVIFVADKPVYDKR